MLATIEQRRAALRASDRGTERYEPDHDDELEKFILSCPLIPAEDLIPLVEHAYVGYDREVDSKYADFVLRQFRQWSIHDDWVKAPSSEETRPRETTATWHPSDGDQPQWVANTPSYLLLATSLLDQGRLLSAMRWQDLEELVAALLERDGWSVQITPPSRDGGFDVIGFRTDGILGPIRSIWQAKKYSSTNLVRLRDVRELSAIRDEQRATKAVIVTTSRLTRDAIAWIRRDEFRLGSIDHDELARWIRRIR